MKGIPLTEKEIAETQAMLDSFKPENLHKRPAKKKKPKKDKK